MPLRSPTVLLSRQTTWSPARWAALRRVLTRILSDHEAVGLLSLALVGDEEIRRIHRDFMGIDAPTDVISFPLRSTEGFDHDPVLGEVVISVDTARREALRRKLTVEREVVLYSIHGTLHLVGLDDLETASKRAMRRAERRYLALYDLLTRPGRSSRRPGEPHRRKTRRPARA